MAATILAALLLAAAPPAAKAPPGPRTTRIGDVTLSNYVSIGGKADGSYIKVSGPNTTIRMPYGNGGGVLLLHADTIEGRGTRSSPFEVVTLTGHPTATITRPGTAGEARLSAHAASGEYRRSTKTATLSGGVDAELADPDRLTGTGELHGETLVADLASEPPSYRLTGSPSTDVVRLSPKPQANAKPLGRITLSNFRSAVLRPGTDAAADGSPAVLSAPNLPDGGSARIRAEELSADFSDQGAETLKASGSVQFHAVEQVGGSSRTIDGTCGTARYEVATSTVRLQDGVEASLTAPDSLRGPAEVVAASLAIAPSADGASRTWTAMGAPNRARVQLRLSRPEPAGGIGSLLGGVLTARGFARASVDPARSADFTGSPAIFESVEQDVGRTSRLMAPRITAAFADGEMAGAEASGGVRWRAERRPAQGDPVSVSGSAPTVRYARDASGRHIAVAGPFTAQYADPAHLAAPGRLTGLAGDELRFTATADGFDYEIESPNGTAVVEFQPKPAEAPPPKPARKGPPAWR